MPGLTHIICAAGSGARMKPFGLDIPKPFMKIGGKTLLEHALDSLPTTERRKIIVVLRAEDQKWTDLTEYPRHVSFTFLKSITRGQAETAYLATEQIETSAIAIFNSDTWFQLPSLGCLVNDQSFDGIIPCARAAGASWSFCLPAAGLSSEPNKIESVWPVAEVREKERISPWASVGYYYFRQADQFCSLVKPLLSVDSPHKEELYIAPLYNSLIKKEFRIVGCEVENFRPLGTPQQLLEYWSETIESVKLQNKHGPRTVS